MTGLFILLFLYTALMKLGNMPAFVNTIQQIPTIQPYKSLLAGMIPGVEIAIVMLLFFPRLRYLGLISATVLMIVFAGYVAFILASMKKLPCSCGGVLKEMTWGQHLLFNLCFAAAGLLAVSFYKKVVMTNRSSRTPVI